MPTSNSPTPPNAMPALTPPPGPPDDGAAAVPPLSWVLEALDEAVLLVDADGRVRWANARAEELLATTRDELLGRPVTDAVPGAPAVDAAARPLTWREQRLVRHDGTALWADVTVAVHRTGVEGEGGDGFAAVYALADATPRVTADAARRRAEERFTSVVEQALDGIYVVQDERFVYVNPGMAALTGYTTDELLAMPSLAALLTPASFVAVRDRFARQLAGRAVEEEGPIVHLRRRDGTIIEIAIRERIAEYGGRPAMVGTAIDVTETRRTEAALRQQALIVDTLHEAVLVLDREWRVVDWNRGAERMFGYRRVEARGREANFVYPPERAARLDARMRSALATNGRWAGELSFVRRSGESGVADVIVVAHHAPDGTPLGYVHVSRDVTDRKRVEAALAAREAELRQSQKMEAVGRLAGGIAHDFNNLLAAISSYAELLLDELPADSTSREDAREIRRAAERGATLTRQLLAFGRQQVMQPREIDLNVVVGELGRLLGRVLGAEVELRLQLAAGSAPVIADPGQVEQVLLNLAVNARDAMPEGGVLTIATSRVVLEDTGRARRVPLPPGRYVRVEVRDTGMGMDEATRARIFEPFFTTKPSGQGTGLGLAMVYGIVAQSGGHVDVDSELGRGSVFAIYLPAAPLPAGSDAARHWSSATPADGAVAVPTSAGAIAAVRAAPPDGGDEDGAGLVVLVVDDEAAVRGAAARVLARRGYAVLEARDGLEALGIAERRQGPIHLLLTDVRMPGMDGRELARRFRGLRPDARVLLMTGYPGPGDEAGGDEALGGVGDAPVLQKPFTLEALAQRVWAVTAR